MFYMDAMLMITQYERSLNLHEFHIMTNVSIMNTNTETKRALGGQMFDRTNCMEVGLPEYSISAATRFYSHSCS